MVINKQDTNGTKVLLQVGELGYDNYSGGGDKGRVYVGEGTANIALAKKSEVDAKVAANADITAGTATKVMYDAKGLVVSGTTLSAGDIPVLDAGKITTGTLPVARGGTGVTISTGTGDLVFSNSPVLVAPTLGVATGTSFNSITGLSSAYPSPAGVSEIGTSTLAARQDHVHPAQTTVSGNAGTATTLATGRTIGMTGDVTWTSASFNGSGDVTGTATLATIADGGTGAFKKISVNSKGLVTGTVNVVQADITGLLGTGSISNTMLANGAVANLSGTNTGDETLATIKTKLGITTLSGSNTGDQTISLTGDVVGNGTGSFVTALKNTGTAGTYRSVTTDAQGRVISGTNPTTISGYGITDAITKVTSTDNAVVRFDGTTGAVQNSGVFIDDNNKIGVGIAPIFSIDIIGSVGSGIRYGDSTKSAVLGTGLTTCQVGSTTAHNLELLVGSAPKVTIDSAGNVGIGVVPSAWSASYNQKALQIGPSGSISSFSAGAGNDQTSIMSNAFDPFNIKYLANGIATRYTQYGGSHIWSSAPSGIAGNAITWTNAMTLDANGDLTVPHTYSNTTASAANMFIDSTGKFFRSTSSKQYKKDIETIDKSYVDTFFDNARPVYYKSLSNNDNPNWGYWGFIAEEISEFDKRLVHLRFDTKEVEVEKERVLEDETIEKYTEIETVNDESKPMIAEGVMYERITVLLTAKAQEQKKIIDSLIKRIEILEEAIK